MDVLSPIIKILQSYAHSIDSSFLPEGKLKQLFEGVITNQVVTDQQAVCHLYGLEAKTGEKKFLMLKRELEKRVIDQLIQHVLQDNHFSHKKQTEKEVSVTKLWCQKQLIFVDILLTHQLYTYAEKVLMRIGKEAEKLHLYHILEETWLLLRGVYIIFGATRKIGAYNRKLVQLGQKKQRVHQARGWLELLQVETHATLARSTALAEQATADAERIALWLKKSNNPFLRYYYHRILAIKWMNLANFDELKALVKKQTTLIKRQQRFRTERHIVGVNLYRVYLC